MKLPAIRYVHTNDDVSLAYAMFGEGPPLMYAFAGPALSNFEHEWNHLGLVEQYEAMAKERTVVRFDWRNCGLSTRHVDDVSPHAHLRDLLALQNHLGFEQVALRMHGSASIALRYAAAHPDRVSSLILSSPSVIVASPDRSPSAGGRLLTIAAQTDWLISQGRAAELAAIPRATFLDALAARKIDVIHVDLDELKHEIEDLV